MEQTPIDKHKAQYYQLVLLWINDPTKFQRYLEYMAPIVSKYGGKGDRSFIPLTIWADAVDLPHVVNLVHYDTKDAYENFKMDPEFLAIEHLRSEATKIISFEGYLREHPMPKTTTEIFDRAYNIEIVTYKNGSSELYRRYEAEGESKMTPYGFNVEFVLDVDPKSNSLNGPDIVKISYFNSVVEKQKFEKDPSHQLIEKVLYPAATERVIWIAAKILPLE
jgi:uncharacterized protein (DUF1330 family)